jgi:hypothetical protein
MSLPQQDKKISFEELNNSTFFKKFKDVYWNGEGSIEFLNNIVLKHPNKCVMLPDLSDIYVLVALQDFPSELLNDEQKNSWYDNNYRIVIGYIWINEKNSEYKNHIEGEPMPKHYIDFIDTRIKGLKLAEYMMYQYECIHNCYIFPKEIIDTASYYWKKYFKKQYALHTIEDYDIFIKDFDLNDNFIKWNNIYFILQIDNSNAIEEK